MPPTPARSRRRSPLQARSRATVDAILEAAARVFEREGYAGATTNHIAAAAGVSIGSLYEYFPDKDALLTALARGHLEEGVALVTRLLAEAPPAEPTPMFVRRVVDAMIALHEDRPRLHRVIFEESPIPPGIARHLADLERTLTSAVELLLRSRSDVVVRDHALAATLVVRTVESLTHAYVLHPQGGASKEAYATEVTRMMVAFLGCRDETLGSSSPSVSTCAEVELQQPTVSRPPSPRGRIRPQCDGTARARDPSMASRSLPHFLRVVRSLALVSGAAACSTSSGATPATWPRPPEVPRRKVARRPADRAGPGSAGSRARSAPGPSAWGSPRDALIASVRWTGTCESAAGPVSKYAREVVE